MYFLYVEILGYVLTSEHSKPPTRASNKSAGYDLYAAEEKLINPWQRVKISSGLKLLLPRETYGHVASRSGLALCHGLFTLTQTIDEDYTGTVYVVLANFSDTEYQIKVGDRIAQLVIQKIKYCQLKQVETLPSTDRNDKGFGSSGY